MTEPTEAMRKAFENACKAREYVTEERARRKARSGVDVRYSTDPCPICKVGQLIWAVMPNDHHHMHCSTEGCVSWVE